MTSVTLTVQKHSFGPQNVLFWLLNFTFYCSEYVKHLLTMWAWFKLPVCIEKKLIFSEKKNYCIYCTADLRLCFCICKLLVFGCKGSYLKWLVAQNVDLQGSLLRN